MAALVLAFGLLCHLDGGRLGAQEPGQATEASATPEPSRVPNEAVRALSSTPPLSLNDCLRQAREIDAALGRLDAEQLDEPTRTTLVARIRSVASYMKFRDDLHATLANYEWLRLGSERVTGTDGDTDVIRPQSPIARVSALSFEAENGDVRLLEVRVFDEKGLRVAGFDRATEKGDWVLTAGLPRREVFHLWRRTTVSRVEVRYAKATTDTAQRNTRVVVYMGRTDRPETAKTAIYHLESTADHLSQRRLAEARSSISEAQRAISRTIESFERERRSGR